MHCNGRVRCWSRKAREAACRGSAEGWAMQEAHSARAAAVAGEPLTPSEVLDAVDRILNDAAFQASVRRRAFFRYLVEETLAGRAGQLKGFQIATAVFGR